MPCIEPPVEAPTTLVRREPGGSKSMQQQNNPEQPTSPLNYYIYAPKPGCKPGQGGLKDLVTLSWYRFELQSSIYMLDPREKSILYMLMLLVVAIGWYNLVKLV